MKKIFIGILVVVLVGVAAYFGTSGDLFQGKFFNLGPKKVRLKVYHEQTQTAEYGAATGDEACAKQKTMTQCSVIQKYVDGAWVDAKDVDCSDQAKSEKFENTHYAALCVKPAPEPAEEPESKTPVCGDGVCEGDEMGSCATDCMVPADDGPPPTTGGGGEGGCPEGTSLFVNPEQGYQFCFDDEKADLEKGSVDIAPETVSIHLNDEKNGYILNVPGQFGSLEQYFAQKSEDGGVENKNDFTNPMETSGVEFDFGSGGASGHQLVFDQSPQRVVEVYVGFADADDVAFMQDIKNTFAFIALYPGPVEPTPISPEPDPYSGEPGPGETASCVYPDQCVKALTRCDLLTTLEKYGFMNAIYTFEAPSEPTFSDLQAEDWCYKYGEFAAANEVIHGYADGSFHPHEVVNRAETADVVYKIAGTPASVGNGGGIDPFNDVLLADGDWYYDFVSGLTNVGALNHFDNGDGNFYPANPTYRDWLVGMLKALNVKKSCDLDEGPSGEEPVVINAGSLVFVNKPLLGIFDLNGNVDLLNFDILAQIEMVGMDTLQFRYASNGDISVDTFELLAPSGIIGSTVGEKGIVTFSGLEEVLEKGNNTNYTLRTKISGAKSNDTIQSELLNVSAVGQASLEKITDITGLTSVTSKMTKS